eukprot:EG_transcript_14062
MEPFFAQPIKVGMTAPLNTEAGKLNAAGLRFALEEANRAGGVLSRNLTLIALNDDYKAAQTLANVQTLVDTEGVVVLAGVAGADNVAAAKPFIVSRGVPLVGAVTGAVEIRTPFQREFVNVRVSNADELVTHALFCVQQARVRRVAFLYQNDSFAPGSLAGLRAALANAGMELVATGGYPRSTTNVEVAVEAIAGAAQKAQVVVAAGLSDAAIRFINLFTADPRADPHCLFSLNSRTWTPGFASQVAPALLGRIYFTFLVPLPSDPGLAIAAHFATAYAAAGGVPEPLAFEGYITGRLIVDVFRRMRSPNPTSAGFLDEVYTDKLFVLDDLVVGMYGTNYSGCAHALCACNAGLRSVHMGQFDPATKALGPPVLSQQFSILQCQNPPTSVTAPLLF